MVVLHACAFAYAVHRPHGATDIDCVNAQLGRGHWPNSATATQVRAVRVLLVWYVGLFAKLYKFSLRGTIRGVSNIRVYLNNRALINEYFMVWLIGVWEIWLIGVSHISADHKAIR